MAARAPILPSLLLGIGLGGFLDGIVMHQLLQWHHLVSAEGCCPMRSLAGLEDNTLADGILHALTWALTMAGVLFAFRAWQAGNLAPPWRRQVGGLLAGWGIFNLLDSVNHLVLGLHHIRDDLGGPAGWDVGFLVLALALIGVGRVLTRSAEPRAAAPADRSTGASTGAR